MHMYFNENEVKALRSALELVDETDGAEDAVYELLGVIRFKLSEYEYKRQEEVSEKTTDGSDA